MTEAPAAGIALDDVTLAYPGGGGSVLNGLSEHLDAGRITAVLGPSGCGKSTLLRLIAGLLVPTSGRLTFRDESGSRDSLEAGELAYVFQDAALLPWRSARDNVTLPLELLGRYGRSQRRALAEQQLQRVGLGAAEWSLRPHELSGGMRMRVSIARALVTDPPLLLLDEPFAALDDMLREHLGQLILQLWSERRRTVVLVTHNIAEAILLSERILIVGRGRILASVPVELSSRDPREVRSTPQFNSLYTQVAERLREAVS